MEIESLTKENFWNDLMEKYPEEMKLFCAWIDEYKKKVDWNNLFASTVNAKIPKYHDLPIAMQFGIFLQFAKESWNESWGGTALISSAGIHRSPGKREFREQSINFITSWFIRKGQINEISEPFKPKSEVRSSDKDETWNDLGNTLRDMADPNQEL